MLDIKLVRERTDEVRAALARRGGDFGLDGLMELDAGRLELIGKTEDLKRQRNEISKEIGKLRKAGQDAGEIQERSRRIGDELKELDGRLKEVEAKARAKILEIPNLPDGATPDGPDETANVELRKWGQPRDFPFEPRSHVDLGQKLGVLDFESAARLAGTRFAVYRGAGAALERALISFMLDVQTRENGYTEIIPPFMVNTETMTGTGQLPKFADDLFRIENTDFWLIPTAEVPLTNIYRGQILDHADLPISLTAHTPCFRAEAGSYGRDTVGLVRQHQFNKVELVKFAAPEDSEAQLEQLTAHAENILQKLGLPYRVVALCAGDLGFSAAKTYDIEVWVPSQQKYREISSCSLFTDYQARRINARFRRDRKAKPEFLHTLNGSGLAVGRCVVAILENFQNEDGSVTIPEPLRPYMGGMETIA